MSQEIDTFNKFFVSMHAASGDIAFLRPVPMQLKRADALLLAAYLVSMADPLGDEFAKVLTAVQNT
jgi:hypothetical protein